MFCQVIQETLRAATIISFTFREAVQDVEYKGGHAYTYIILVCLIWVIMKVKVHLGLIDLGYIY